MGAQLSTQAPTAVVSIDAYVAELAEFTYTGDLSRARFLKTVKVLHREGEAVAKVFIKPSLQFDLSEARAKLEQYQKVLAAIPNAIGFARIVENDRAGYLIRQHIKHNLYDRISTRPFLEPVEKLWIMFQLLMALRDAHAQGVFHGDIKAENVLISSWKWVYLADWLPFKPTSLPETDSTQFLFYFNTSGRRVCYVAPERFGERAELDAAGDVYSLGCVFAELLMEKPLFSLADSFKYKKGELQPQLEPGPARDLVASMISLDPSKRNSAEQYLSDPLFPEYFWDLYKLASPFCRRQSNNANSMVHCISSNLDSIFSFLGVDVGPDIKPSGLVPYVVASQTRCWQPSSPPPAGTGTDQFSGALILLAMSCSQIQSTADVATRLRAIDLLMAFSAFVSDEIKLNRSLPYLVAMLKDRADAVQIAAIAAITHLTTITGGLSSLNARVFTEYLMPRLRAVQAASDRVKAAYAACLPVLAEAMYRLEDSETLGIHVEAHVRALLVESSSEIRRAVLGNFDTLCTRMGRAQTNDIFLSHTVTYLNDHDPQVRRMLFSFVARIGPLVGPASLEQYVVPLMLQSLTDDEETVRTVLASLSSMVELGLVRQKLVWQLLKQVVKFFIHPNEYIRTETFLLVAHAARWMKPAQLHCLLKPLLEQFLQFVVVDYCDHRSYISAVKPHISQRVFSIVQQWAKAEDSQFFSQKAVAFSAQDKRWMERLREVGFNNEDLWQLVLYRDYMKQRKPLPDPKEVVKALPLPHTWERANGDAPLDLEQYVQTSAGAAKQLSFELEQCQIGASRAEFSVQGTLVTSAKAHRGAVTSIAVCPDHNFFVTASDDKLVKVWDTRTAAKGSSRPVQTKDMGAPVKSLDFIGATHTFAAGCAGFVALLQARCTIEESVQYGALEEIFRHQISGVAVALRHVAGLLYILRSDYAIEVLDLSSLESRVIVGPPEHGPPTCWCFGDGWLAVGTAHGVVDVWDLRFEILVQSWGFGDLCPITSISLHPRSQSRWIIVGGGFDRHFITSWEVQSAECREVLVPYTEEDAPLLRSITGPDLEQRLLMRPMSTSFASIRAATALCASGDVAGKHQTLISGGSDCVLRFWDLQAPQNCKIISGLSYDHAGMTYSSRITASVRTTNEKLAAVKHKPARKVRVSVISDEERDIGRNHRGTVTGVGLVPFQSKILVVSVDEVGYLKIFM